MVKYIAHKPSPKEVDLSPLGLWRKICDLVNRLLFLEDNRSSPWCTVKTYQEAQQLKVRKPILVYIQEKDALYLKSSTTLRSLALFDENPTP